MCGGGGGGGNDALNYQKRQEQLRQTRIRTGMDQLRAIFDGGRAGANAASSFDPNTTYYDSKGNVVYSPGSLPAAPPAPTRPGAYFSYAQGGFVDANGNQIGISGYSTPTGPSAREQAIQALKDKASMGQLFTGTQEYKGFQPSFYDKQKQAYLDYANPQLQEQMGKARRNLTFALSRAGTLSSSIAARNQADLGKSYARQQRQIASRAQDVANQARSGVSQQRDQLTRTLQATADPSAVTDQIGGIMQTLRSTPNFQPLAPVLQDAGAGIGAYRQGYQYGQMRRNIQDYFRNPNSSSGSIVNN